MKDAHQGKHEWAVTRTRTRSVRLVLGDRRLLLLPRLALVTFRLTWPVGSSLRRRLCIHIYILSSCIVASSSFRGHLDYHPPVDHRQPSVDYHLRGKGEAQTRVVRHPMESEQRASFRILEAVSQDRDIRQEAQTSRDVRQRSEHIRYVKLQKTSEHFHDTNERNIAESHRIVADRDQAVFKGRPFLHTNAEEKTKSET